MTEHDYDKTCECLDCLYQDEDPCEKCGKIAFLYVSKTRDFAYCEECHNG